MQSVTCRHCGSQVTLFSLLESSICPNCHKDIREQPIENPPVPTAKPVPPASPPVRQPPPDPVPTKTVSDADPRPLAPGRMPVRPKYIRSARRFYLAPPHVFRLIFYSLWLSPPVLVVSVGFLLAVIDDDQRHYGERPAAVDACGLCCFGFLWFGFAPIPAYIAASLFTPFFVRDIRCPWCHFQMDAVGEWHVGGYVDHRKKHIWYARSPINNTVVGHIPCPKCDQTIFIRPYELTWSMFFRR